MSTTNTNTRLIRVLGVIMALVLVFTPSLVNIRAQEANPADVADLNAQIEAKKRALEELQSRSAALQHAVDQASSQVRDIQSQVALIDAQIAQSSFAIDQKNAEIEALELEMTAIQQSIDSKTAEISVKKKQLADALRQMDANNRVSPLALVVLQESLADFYGHAQAVASLSASLNEAIDGVETLREELTSKQDSLVAAKDEHTQAKQQLEIQRNSVVDQRSFKTELLDDASSSKNQYESLLAQAAQEEQQANATISSLEQQIQNRLNGNTNNDYPTFNSTGYVWPTAEHRITAYFHDPTYPFKRYIGEHTGLDIGVPQGSLVRATADGIVSVVRNQGFFTDSAGRKTRSALNFVGIIHDDGISSRYLHLSAIYVSPEQFVKQGEIIGLSGGLPGTAGAGTTTTGAHLHFEIRVDGIPDDPLKYLP